MVKNILNIYEQVERNKRRSGLVILFFVVFVVFFVWIIGQGFEADPGTVALAVGLSLASSMGGYFWGDKMILKLSGGKPANKKDHYLFYTVVENLSLASQIPFPQLYVIESPALNAFATGRDPQHATICITTGLLDKLDRTELEGVIAHEISHVRNFDIRLMTIVAVFVGTITLLGDWLLRSRRSSSSKKGASSVLMGIGLVSLIFTPIAARLIQLAVSRSREYLADSTAIKLTRQPQGLISALKKLGAQAEPLKTARLGTAHLFIVNPFGGKQTLSGAKVLFSTHPPLSARIKALESMF